MTTQTTKIVPDAEDRPGPIQSQTHRVGTVLWDRYEVLAVLGSSLLGELWRCLDRTSGAEVALRWLPPDLRRSKPALALIHAGIRRISDQIHPNMAAIRQMVYMGDQIYLVGDFAPGVDVGTWARNGAGGRRTLEETLPVLRQAAAALDFAHARQIVHRNLKPSNVYLDSAGTARVTDFSLVPNQHVTLLRGAAVRAGSTGPYLAPELHRREPPDSASDQYALAVLAWELLAGAPPEGAGGENPPDFLPSGARAALRRAMAPKPRNRFVSCSDFVRALGGERVAGRRKRSKAEWRRICRLAELVVSVAALGAAGWFGGPAVVAWMNRPKPPPEKAPDLDIVKPAAPKKEEPKFQAPDPLQAATPMPVEGQPWVTLTGRMQFVWVPPMAMWVGRYEVANEEFLLMDPAHDSGEFRGQSMKGPRQPVVRVNIDDCVAFADWLTERERAAGKLGAGWRYRLPSRLEAIAYTRAGVVHTYPWGETWPPTRGNYADGELSSAFTDLPFIANYQDGFAVTAPVEFSGENPWGLFGAGGNVWETTSKEPGWKQFGGWQGGGWDDYQSTRMKPDMLYGYIGNARGAVNGFRLVLAPIAGETPPPPDPAAAKPAGGI